MEIQHRFSSCHKKTVSDSLPQKFSSHVIEGHIKSALRLLAADTTGGVLLLDSDIDGVSVQSVLLKKHPQLRPHLSYVNQVLHFLHAIL